MTTDHVPVTFDELLDVMQQIHRRKDADYSGGEAYSNFAGSEELGVPAHIGAAIRMRDKWQRAVRLLRTEWAGGDDPHSIGPAVADETIDDTLIDLANYALIVYILRERWRNDNDNG